MNRFNLKSKKALLKNRNLAQLRQSERSIDCGPPKIKSIIGKVKKNTRSIHMADLPPPPMI